MPEKSPKSWVQNAMSASDLLQSYVDIAADNLEELQPESQQELVPVLEAYDPTGPEEAGAKAILLHLLKTE